MHKKTAHKRKISKSSRNTLTLNKFLTFPVLVIVAFAVLVVITLFQITRPVEGVQGVQVSISQE